MRAITLALLLGGCILAPVPPPDAGSGGGSVGGGSAGGGSTGGGNAGGGSAGGGSAGGGSAGGGTAGGSAGGNAGGSAGGTPDAGPFICDAGLCGRFTGTGMMADPRIEHGVVLLPTGHALAVGGSSGAALLASSERYDPDSGTWSDAGRLTTPRHNFSIAALPSGKVIVAGGRTTGNALLSSTEIWDPQTSSWSPGPALTTGARANAFTAVLPGGKVLIGLGYVAYPDCGYRRDTEIYDPGTNQWTASGLLARNRSDSQVAVLADGRVLVAGGPANGCPSTNPGIVASELYQLDGGWTATDDLLETRCLGAATTLNTGEVLISAGSCPGLKLTAELYDPQLGMFSPTGAMAMGRYFFGSTLLASGRVVHIGGTTGVATLGSAELYDPPSRRWFVAPGAMVTPRVWGTATLLLDGRVLITGGQDGTGVLPAAELFDETR